MKTSGSGRELVQYVFSTESPVQIVPETKVAIESNQEDHSNPHCHMKMGEKPMMVVRWWILMMMIAGPA